MASEYAAPSATIASGDRPQQLNEFHAGWVWLETTLAAVGLTPLLAALVLLLFALFVVTLRRSASRPSEFTVLENAARRASEEKRRKNAPSSHALREVRLRRAVRGGDTI